MTELKCPFCGQELKPQTMDGEWLECWDCSYHEPTHRPFPQRILCGTKELWQELIRTRKELEQSEICCTEWEKQALDYKAENIALSGDLERTRKALEIAVDALEMIDSGKILEHSVFGHEDETKTKIAHSALEQITAEQKDVK